LNGERVAVVSYLSGLENAKVDNLSAPLCPGKFVDEHVNDLADRLRALPSEQRLLSVTPTGDSGDFDVVVGADAANLHFKFGDDAGVVCIAAITSNSRLWRRLMPDPRISNDAAAHRYAKLVDAGLIPDKRGTAQLAEIREGFDRFYPEDEYPHPCGLDERLKGVITTLAADSDSAAVMTTVGQYVAFCPYVDQDRLAAIVAGAAPAEVPSDLSALVRKMFEAAE